MLSNNYAPSQLYKYIPLRLVLQKCKLLSVAVNILASFYLKSRWRHKGNPEVNEILFTTYN